MRGRRTMAGKFEIYKDKAGEFRFRLRAANGEIILASEGYKAKAGAKNGIASVGKNAKSAGRFEKKTTGKGKPFFVLKAGNQQVIGTSEVYETDRARDAGIASVTKNAPAAKTDDKTL